jgi:hypothetical protein
MISAFLNDIRADVREMEDADCVKVYFPDSHSLRAGVIVGILSNKILVVLDGEENAIEVHQKHFNFIINNNRDEDDYLAKIRVYMNQGGFF